MNEKCGAAETKDDTVSTLKIGLLIINLKQANRNQRWLLLLLLLLVQEWALNQLMLSVVSIPIKVNGFVDSLVCSPLGPFHLILEHCSLKMEFFLVKMGPHINE